VKSIPLLRRPCPLIDESGSYIYGVGSRLLDLNPSPLDQNPLNSDCFLADRFRNPKMTAMMRTTRQPMTIPAIAPVDSLGSFLAAWLLSLSGIVTDDGIGGLNIDKDGVVGGAETVDGDGNSVDIGARVVVVVGMEDDSSLVDVAPTGMLIVGEGGAVTKAVVVTGEGISGVFVVVGV